MRDVPCTLIIAGGAINPAEGEYQEGVLRALHHGKDLLLDGGSALDVAQAVASAIEDDPLFNCGTGSRLNLKGQAEMDACIMDGRGLHSGAVACVRGVQNPIAVARKVLDETDHNLLVGEGAEIFAHAMGFPPYDPTTEAKREEWATLTESLKLGRPLPERYASVLRNFTRLKDWLDDDTVGVVARDRRGDMAAATSSGGGPLKMPGRVGDVPLVGCGLYVDNRAGGAVLSGSGEVIMRYLAAKTASDLMSQGLSAQQAAERVVVSIQEKAPTAVVSILTLSSSGEVGGARNVPTTPHAAWHEDEGVSEGFATILGSV